MDQCQSITFKPETSTTSLWQEHTPSVQNWYLEKCIGWHQNILWQTSASSTSEHCALQILWSHQRRPATYITRLPNMDSSSRISLTKYTEPVHMFPGLAHPESHSANCSPARWTSSWYLLACLVGKTLADSSHILPTSNRGNKKRSQKPSWLWITLKHFKPSPLFPNGQAKLIWCRKLFCLSWNNWQINQSSPIAAIWSPF